MSPSLTVQQKVLLYLEAQREQYIPKVRALQILFEPGWFSFSLPLFIPTKYVLLVTSKNKKELTSKREDLQVTFRQMFQTHYFVTASNSSINSMSSSSEQALGGGGLFAAYPTRAQFVCYLDSILPESLRDPTGEDTVEVAGRHSPVQPVQRLLFLVFT